MMYASFRKRQVATSIPRTFPLAAFTAQHPESPCFTSPTRTVQTSEKSREEALIAVVDAMPFAAISPLHVPKSTSRPSGMGERSTDLTAMHLVSEPSIPVGSKQFGLFHWSCSIPMSAQSQLLPFEACR